MTKSEICQTIVDSYKVQTGVEEIGLVDITKHGLLAVACEYLGLLPTADMKAYAKTRAGILPFGLTLRGILESIKE